ncbi:MAG: VOC family protein [Kineosporiaceae bacterium]|jgi:predicted enzyme related to lactoylglutathione lyase
MSAGPIGHIREVVLDTPDPGALARFYAGLLSGEPVEWYPGWVTLEPPPNGLRLSFQASGARPPDDVRRVHVDVLVDDLDAAHARVVGAGGVFLGRHVSPRPGADGTSVPWRVYADPAGHRFCLVVR